MSVKFRPLPVLYTIVYTYVGRENCVFLRSDHSTGGKSSGYGAQVKSPSQIVFLFSLVLKVAEKLYFCSFPKGERTIFAWTQDWFSLDGRGDNSKHIHEKKWKKVMIDLNGPHPSEYRKYS